MSQLVDLGPQGKHYFPDDATPQEMETAVQAMAPSSFESNKPTELKAAPWGVKLPEVVQDVASTLLGPLAAKLGIPTPMGRNPLTGKVRTIGGLFEPSPLPEQNLMEPYKHPETVKQGAFNIGANVANVLTTPGALVTSMLGGVPGAVAAPSTLPLANGGTVPFRAIETGPLKAIDAVERGVAGAFGGQMFYNFLSHLLSKETYKGTPGEVTEKVGMLPVEALGAMAGAKGALREGKLAPQPLQEKATTVQPPGDTSLRSRLEKVAANEKSPYSALANQLLKVKSSTLDIPVVEDPSLKGAARTKQGRVEVNPSFANEDFPLLHEAVHAMTPGELLQSGVAESLRDSYNRIRADFELKGQALPHGLRNLDEFLAEGLTNPAFQQDLKFQRAAGRSTLDKVIDTGLGVVGRARTKGSVLEQVLPEMQKIVSKDQPLQLQDRAPRVEPGTTVIDSPSIKQTYAMPLQTEDLVKKLPGPRGNFAVDSKGQTVNLDDLSQAEQGELMRGPKEYTAPRRFEETPIIGGEKSGKVIVPEQSTRNVELIKPQEPRVPRRPFPEEGGQGSPKPYGSLFRPVEDKVEREMTVDETLRDLPSGSGKLESAQEKARSGKSLYSGLGLEDREKELRGSLYLAGPRIAMTPSEVGFKNVTKEVDAQQLYNRLKNKVSPSEWSFYQDVLPKTGKVTPENVAKIMQESGPRVEVKKLEAVRSSSVLAQRVSEIQHKIETKYNDWIITGARNITYYNPHDNSVTRYNQPSKIPHPEVRKLMEEYEKLNKQSREEEFDSATSRYQMVNPKPLNQMPGAVDLLVRIPRRGEAFWSELIKKPYSEMTLKERQLASAYEFSPEPDVKYKSSHYPKAGKNVITHARGYMEKTKDGKNVFRVFEVQSDWAQDLREQKGSGKKMGINDDPLLNNYERTALKAVIKHAIDVGADAVALDDAETAMMTEQHDQEAGYKFFPNQVGKWVVVDKTGESRLMETEEVFNNQRTTEELAKRAEKNGILAPGWTVVKVTPEMVKLIIDQEGGMRFHYDQTLPKIMEELTGVKGESVDFGEHQNASRDNRVQRKDLLFKNSDGSLKTTSTARLYDLSKVKTKQPFDLIGKDKLESRPQYAYSGLGLEEIPIQSRKYVKKFKLDLDTLKHIWNSRGTKHSIAGTADGVETTAHNYGIQAENSIKLAAQKEFGQESVMGLKGALVYLEAHGDPQELSLFAQQASNNKEALAAVSFAKKNWARLKPVVDAIDMVDTGNAALAKQFDLGFTPIQDYLKRMYDHSDEGILFRESRPPGIGATSKMQRKWPTLFSAIEAGETPLTYDASALVGKRTSEIMLEVAQKEWVDQFKKVVDTTLNLPILADLDTSGKTHLAPPGYEPVEVIPGHKVGVLKGYASLFDAISGTSRISKAKLGQASLQIEGGLKHGTLLFDSFHALRILQFRKSFGLKDGYEKGLSLLEYSDKDLLEAAKQGLIPDEAVQYAKETMALPQGKLSNREGVALLSKNGLNVGRHSEALYTNFVRAFPLVRDTVGKFNRLVFDKLSRGAMAEAGLIELERIGNLHPEWSLEKVAQTVARDLDFRFGSIGRQSLFKSRTMQDLTSLLLLAPRWVESMGRSEIGSVKQLVRAAVPGKEFLKPGSLGESSAKLLATYIVATQVMNLVSKGQLTVDNEEGHKLDAWIPPLTKNGKGFWLSPLSVVAELSHDMWRYSRTQGLLESAGSIVENKLSPLGRAGEIAILGRDWNNRNVKDTWERVKRAAVTLANPTPLPVRQSVKAITSGDVTPLERQAFAMAGFKAEPESMREQLERKEEGMELPERARTERAFRESQPVKDEDQKQQAAERSIEKQFERRELLNEALTREQQKWVKEKGFTVPGYNDVLVVKGAKVTLTKEEAEKFQEMLAQAHGATIEGLMKLKKFNDMPVGKQKEVFHREMLLNNKKVLNDMKYLLESGKLNQNKKQKRFSILP